MNLEQLTTPKNFTEGIWSALESRGYCVLDGINDTAQHFDLARSLGCIQRDLDGSLLKRLFLRDSLQARGPSLCSKYGKGAYPFHTDTASWADPIRLLCMRAVDGDFRRGTRVISGSEFFGAFPESLVRRSCWATMNGRRSFYCGMEWGNGPDLCRRYRCDTACMTPINEAAKQLSSMLHERSSLDIGMRIEWQPGRVLILDNWRMLHARCRPVVNEGERVLERIYIKNEF
jgi:hypothetical protein